MSHVACPPRLKPAKTHSPMVRSSFGNKYAGRVSMRNETSFTAPAAQRTKRSVLPHTREIMACDGFPHLSCHTCRYCVVRKDIKSADISETIRSQSQRYLRMAFVMVFRLTTPSPVLAFVHSSLSMIPLVLWWCHFVDHVIMTTARP